MQRGSLSELNGPFFFLEKKNLLYLPLLLLISPKDESDGAPRKESKRRCGCYLGDLGVETDEPESARKYHKIASTFRTALDLHRSQGEKKLQELQVSRGYFFTRHRDGKRKTEGKKEVLRASRGKDRICVALGGKQKGG